MNVEAFRKLQRKLGVAKRTRRPGIRSSGPKAMSAAEREYELVLLAQFRTSAFFSVKFEAFTFKLPGGNYTPDFTIWDGNTLILVVEVKGAYRLGSAGRSHFAFKTAREAWPKIPFRFAQKTREDGWIETTL